jgi:uncharacterized protein YdeI (YjbR/CyaY-like superfamily)
VALDAIYFDSPASFGRWLDEHHASAPEVLAGYHKKHSGRPSMTWAESVDEALCYGWIDGIRRRVDDDRYTIRFTPRKPRRIWSAVNIERVAELTRLGRMQPSGNAAYAQREPSRSAIYAYEQRSTDLEHRLQDRFRANAAAWAFYEAQPAGYRKTANWWVMSAKQETTRLRRLETLIQDSASGRRVAATLSPGRKQP